MVGAQLESGHIRRIFCWAHRPFTFSDAWNLRIAFTFHLHTPRKMTEPPTSSTEKAQQVGNWTEMTEFGFAYEVDNYFNRVTYPSDLQVVQRFAAIILSS